MKTFNKSTITFTQLKNIIVESEINESSLTRIAKWIESKECAMITAWRSRYTHITDKTFKPIHDDGTPFAEGDEFTKKEKRTYNKELKAALLHLGYGVTEIRGVFREEGCEGCDSGQEESFLVVNLKDDPKFKDQIFKLSEYYNQDCFMYSPLGSTEGINIGTNNSDWPGYKNEEPAGTFKLSVQAMFMSRIKNNGFAFGDRSNMKPDDRMNFKTRKSARKLKSLDECFESINDYNIGGHRSIFNSCKKVIESINN